MKNFAILLCCLMLATSHFACAHTGLQDSDRTVGTWAVADIDFDPTPAANAFAAASDAGISAPLSERTVQLRIVNVTPDGSAYDASRFNADYDERLLQSIDIANQDFANRIQFRIADDYDGMVLFAEAPNDLRYYYDGLMREIPERIEEYQRLTMTNSEPGLINVFVFDTPTAPDSILTGFTGVMENPDAELLQRLSPHFDRVCISYRSLGTGTLSHELGHYYYLPHTWQAVEKGVAATYGLTNVDSLCVNRMSYNCYKQGFTKEQKEVVSYAQATWRDYLED